MAYSRKDYLQQVMGKWTAIPVPINANLPPTGSVSTIVHKFSLEVDYEDELNERIIEKISNWLKTEHGRWVIANCVTQPSFICQHDVFEFAYFVAIEAKLQHGADVWHQLKWG